MLRCVSPASQQPRQGLSTLRPTSEYRARRRSHKCRQRLNPKLKIFNATKGAVHKRQTGRTGRTNRISRHESHKSRRKKTHIEKVTKTRQNDEDHTRGIMPETSRGGRDNLPLHKGRTCIGAHRHTHRQTDGGGNETTQVKHIRAG